MQGERNRFEGLIQKLQSKCQSMHQETVELKSALKKNEVELDRLLKNEQEQESIMELATLDREMAEERAEQAEAEVEALRQKLEEKELELDILHSEANLLTEDMSDDAKHAAGHYRLQTENDRLKEALLRLKEITEEEEEKLKSRVKELETDVALLDELREVTSDLKNQTIEQEATIDLLRQQLDATNASEEIIEELSEQNQQLKEQLSERDIIIRDLENLKELNDELEAHHIEQANDLRIELEEREAELAEQAQRFREQDAALTEQDQLINKFRDLVLELQTRMNDAESSKTMTEEQAKDVEGRFNDVMELNRRLHNAHITSTAKTIQSELQKLQAEEAKEELQIVKYYLPESPDFFQNDSLRAYFCSKRVGFKSELSRSLLKNAGMQVGSPPELDKFLHELSRLDTIQILAQIHLKSTRFSAALAVSSLEHFEACRPAYEELQPVEKNIERCLDALKKDELNFKETPATLRRSDMIMGSINIDFAHVLASRPEDESICRISSIKSNLEMFKACFDTIKTCLDAVGIEEENEELREHIYKKFIKPSNKAAECIVAANKLIRTLTTLRDDSLYPEFSSPSELVEQDEFVAHTAQAAQQFAANLCKFFIPADDPEVKPIPAYIISKSMDTLEDEHFANHEIMKLGNTIECLNRWNDWSSNLTINIEIEHGPAPWEVKSKQIESSKIPRAEAEEELKKLAADHRTTMLQVRERDELLETKNLEIEHLKAKERETLAKLLELGAAKEELVKVQGDYLRFRTEVGKEIAELQRKEAAVEMAAKSHGPVPKITDGTNKELKLEETPSQIRASAEYATIMAAYRKENKYLRKRVEKKTFDSHMELVLDLQKKVQVAQAEKHALSERDAKLAKSLSVEEPGRPEPPRTPRKKVLSSQKSPAKQPPSPTFFGLTEEEQMEQMGLMILDHRVNVMMGDFERGFPTYVF